MTTAVAIAVVLLVLVATNLWVQAGPGRAHLVTGPAPPRGWLGGATTLQG